MKKLIVILLLIGFGFSMVGCLETKGNTKAPDVPDAVKPFITKTLEQGAPGEFHVTSLDSGSLVIREDKNYFESLTIKLFLFEDRDGEYSISQQVAAGGAQPGPMTVSYPTRWSYANGVISIEKLGEFKIEGSNSGKLILKDLNSSLQMIPPEKRESGISMTMKDSWIQKGR